jgi:hypothetical protein
MRDAVDVDVPRTNGTDADGEGVWSRRPDAGAKFRASSKGFREATVAIKHWLTEESTQ